MLEVAEDTQRIPSLGFHGLLRLPRVETDEPSLAMTPVLVLEVHLDELVSALVADVSDLSSLMILMLELELGLVEAQGVLEWEVWVR